MSTEQYFIGFNPNYSVFKKELKMTTGLTLSETKYNKVYKLVCETQPKLLSECFSEADKIINRGASDGDYIIKLVIETAERVYATRKL